MNYEEKITIMQNNFKHIRKYLHLTCREFGEMLGTTKQTISNIENGRTKLTKIQYLAIMYVLNTEIIPDLDDMKYEGLLKLLNRKAIERHYIETLTFEEES